MRMTEVVSSNIKKIGWENGILRVEFFNGTYEYDNVPREVWEQFQDADSKGQFLSSNIKGVYEFRKL